MKRANKAWHITSRYEKDFKKEFLFRRQEMKNKNPPKLSGFLYCYLINVLGKAHVKLPRS